MKCFLGEAEEYITNSHCSKQQDNFQAFEVFHFHTVEIRLIECELTQTLEKRDGDIGLPALLLRVCNCR